MLCGFQDDATDFFLRLFGIEVSPCLLSGGTNRCATSGQGFSATLDQSRGTTLAGELGSRLILFVRLSSALNRGG